MTFSPSQVLFLSQNYQHPKKKYKSFAEVTISVAFFSFIQLCYCLLGDKSLKVDTSLRSCIIKLDFSFEMLT